MSIESVQKIAQSRGIRADYNNKDELIQAGANIIVVGSAIIKSEDFTYVRFSFKTYLKAFTTLVLAHRNFATFFTASQKQSNVNAPRMCINICTLFMADVLVASASIGILCAILFISAWSLCVVRFNLQGNAKASMCEASNNAKFHAFFMSILT